MDNIDAMELRNRRLSSEADYKKEGGEQQQQQQQQQQQGMDVVEKAQHKLVADNKIELEEKVFIETMETSGAMELDTNGHSDEEDRLSGGLGIAEDGDFFGVFEEIEEDEDVERFISQNNTPTVSTRQSPEARGFLRSSAFERGQPVDAAAISSDSEDESSFETIPGQTEAVENTDTLEKDSGYLDESINDNEHNALRAETNGTGDRTAVGATKTGTAIEDSATDGTESSWYLLPEDMARLKDLQKEFRLKRVPDLPQSLFFSANVYKSCSVLPATPSRIPSTEAVEEKATHAEATNTAPVAPPQKPSSLRSSARGGVPNQVRAPQRNESSTDGCEPAVNGGNRYSGEEKSEEPPGAAVSDGPGAAISEPTSPRSTRRSRAAQSQDDVMDTLLGAMSSPNTRSGQPRPQLQPSSQSQSQPQQPKAGGDSSQTIPNDMLVAMMAVESSAEKPAPGAAHHPENAAKAVASCLPKGYTGPFSQLSAEENAYFIGLLQRIKGGGVGAKESSDYQRLKAKVDAEQQRFRAQAREKALPLLKNVLEGINVSACKELSREGAEALNMYPQLYMPVRVRAIRSSASGYVPLVYCDTLFQKGACYHVSEALQSSKDMPIREDVDPWAGRAGQHEPVSRDPIMAELAERADADVVISASTLVALLTLPQAYMRDVVIPFQVAEAAEHEAGAEDARRPRGARRRVVVDRPLQPTHAATPQRLSQMYSAAFVQTHAVDPNRPLELAGGSMAKAVTSAGLGGGESGNATYTLWEFSGLRVLIRYGVHSFVRDGAAAAPTTVTLASKVESQLLNTSAEGTLAAAGGAVYEEISESERLAWWMSSYVRGSPSEVWVAHVDAAKPAVVRVARHTCADLFPSADAQPPTRGVADLLHDLLRLDPGHFLLAHRRRTWDATIYKALEVSADAAAAAVVSPRTRETVLDLSTELRPIDRIDPARADVEGDYVPAAWHGIPGLVPYTYAPADTAEYCPRAATWNKSAPVGRGGRRRNASKRKKKSK
ncbi:hypothetical protein COEREDRAFT_80338 [Coemansia reversa NRRL 1564]|uniref:Uncharacterized protein n=1 Tax=Coemansia reversa (strain ATCC 12441 / NRRL 1564) TaxID=763665 RepID=A0A2G5BF48_COERN|nr:hypothetical protein COEREDRAFT_80338 [Coemansia reversa NRRL 1564]|eukprot:PIA17639.1 hypothetical protein COEREDRAFT_80338 [Coemansia reversa NRRL 1564]